MNGVRRRGRDGVRVRTDEVRAVFPTMGTVASLRIGTHRLESDPGLAIAAVGRVQSVLDEAEERFTPYRPSSELCRYRAGWVTAPSPELLEVLAACRELRRRTGGGFNDCGPDGLFDPTGFVKGWAAERAVLAARDMGVADICLAVGGDVRASGWAPAGRPWRVAVRSPAPRAEVIEVVQARTPGGPLAVATSGRYERGDHFRGPVGAPDQRSPARADGLGSVTVVGEDLGIADGLSTALWALGSREGAAAARAVAAEWPGIELLLVDVDGRPLPTPEPPALAAG